MRVREKREEWGGGESEDRTETGEREERGRR